MDVITVNAIEFVSIVLVFTVIVKSICYGDIRIGNQIRFCHFLYRRIMAMSIFLVVISTAITVTRWINIAPSLSYSLFGIQRWSYVFIVSTILLNRTITAVRITRVDSIEDLRDIRYKREIDNDYLKRTKKYWIGHFALLSLPFIISAIGYQLGIKVTKDGDEGIFLADTSNLVICFVPIMMACMLNDHSDKNGEDQNSLKLSRNEMMISDLTIIIWIALDTALSSANFYKLDWGSTVNLFEGLLFTLSDLWFAVLVLY